MGTLRDRITGATAAGYAEAPPNIVLPSNDEGSRGQPGRGLSLPSPPAGGSPAPITTSPQAAIDAARLALLSALAALDAAALALTSSPTPRQTAPPSPDPTVCGHPTTIAVTALGGPPVMVCADCGANL